MPLTTYLGANTLLAHFHYINAGVYPFSKNCADKQLQALVGADNRNLRFIYETRCFAERYSEFSSALAA